MASSPFFSVAIIPAAGRSRRMGRPKLLLPWDGTTIIERVIENWRRARVDHVVLVTHPDDGELAAAGGRAGADVVVADPPPPEMKDSVLVGLRYAAKTWRPGPTDAWLLAPGDMPRMSPAVIANVLAAYDPAAPEIIVPNHAGRRGHPVLFPWSWADAAERLPAGAGLDQLLVRSPPRLVDFPPNLWADDIDTPDDYERRDAE